MAANLLEIGCGLATRRPCLLHDLGTLPDHPALGSRTRGRSSRARPGDLPVRPGDRRAVWGDYRRLGQRPFTQGEPTQKPPTQSRLRADSQGTQSTREQISGSGRQPAGMSSPSRTRQGSRSSTEFGDLAEGRLCAREGMSIVILLRAVDGAHARSVFDLDPEGRPHSSAIKCYAMAMLGTRAGMSFATAQALGAVPR